jgi:hypothetical protein
MKLMRNAPLIIGLVLAADSTIARDIGLPTSPGPQRTNPWLETNFITPLDLRLTVPENDVRRGGACRGVRPAECPQMLIWGGTRQGGLPTLDPVLTSDPPPHVRVKFVLQRLYPGHTDVQTVLPLEELSWVTHSSVADQEIGEFEIGYVDEQHVDANGYFFNPPVIYDALVLNACDGFSSFPVSHEADFDPDGFPTMPFSGFDDSTIDSTGFYQFSYAILVDGDEMGPPYETRLNMSGKVSVLCTSVDTL